jgi:hypothetical protein
MQEDRAQTSGYHIVCEGGGERGVPSTSHFTSRTTGLHNNIIAADMSGAFICHEVQ